MLAYLEYVGILWHTLAYCYLGNSGNEFDRFEDDGMIWHECVMLMWDGHGGALQEIHDVSAPALLELQKPPICNSLQDFRWALCTNVDQC